MTELIYINFPILILQNVFTQGIYKVCNDILKYSCYAYLSDSDQSIAQKIKSAHSFYGINYSKTSYEEGKTIYDSYPINSPKAGVKADMLFDFRDNSKTDFEIDAFLAFCAIRSILQKQNWFRVTKRYVVARMAGLAKIKDMKNPPKKLEKYLKRYHFNKLIKELTDNWGLRVYGEHINGLYISFKMTRADLGYTAELNKKKNRAELERNSKKAENESIKQRVTNELNKHAYATP